MVTTLSEISETWDVLCSVYASRGIDLGQFLHEAATSEKTWLMRWHCKDDFDELCRLGCGEVPLTIALWVIRSSPRWSHTWRTVVGSKRRRDQTVAALEKAASALETLDNSFAGAVSNLRRSRERIPHDAVPPIASTEDGMVRRVPHPSSMSGALRKYSRVFKRLGNLAKETAINSPEAFGKYLICSFVKVATGNFHDDKVSALIGSALGETYSETAHRMWRSRNYKAITNVSFPVELLIGIGTVIANEA